jgi:glycosyltransferase involved in cell wall biosynthesis
MTAISRLASAAASSGLDAAWRAEREREQQLVLPGGRVLVTCSAPLGSGGLGRHLSEIVQGLERGGADATCLCPSSRTCASNLPRASRRPVDGPSASHANASLTAAARGPALSILSTATRSSPSWQAWAANVRFDLDAAAGLPPADHLIAFNGQALAQFRAASKRGAGRGGGPGGRGAPSLSLMSANCHLRRVLRMHEQAHRRHPIERSWATRLLARNLAEYELAESIYVASRHALESFVQEGVPERRLSLFPLTPDPRFAPDPHFAPGPRFSQDPRLAPATAGERASESDCFEVVYVGSLSVVKGVPLLIEAVGRLAHADLRLVLVGGWSTRAMRRFLERACARDRRIVLQVGDPLPHLRRAALCVHPSYEDGFGYAPVEALACGVPAIVSENTGAKELIVPGRNGLVVATGDEDALAQAIDCVYRGGIPDG